MTPLTSYITNIYIKTIVGFIVIIITLTANASGYPLYELPFCPGGGPPGWMNHFNYKRDQNIRRHNPYYQSPYLRPYLQRAPYPAPNFYQPHRTAPYYSSPPVNKKPFARSRPPAVRYQTR